MAKRIHPAFKNFILNNALDYWDKILKEEGVPEGVKSGVCFTTSNAFCKIFDRDLGIPCRLEMVETIAGNDHALDLFDHYCKEGDIGAFFIHLEHLNKTKGKENLTPSDPVIVGMGAGGRPDQFHFVMNLHAHGEAVDLTLDRIKRPQWGISCNNYWAKYDSMGYKNDAIFSSAIRRQSKCVLMTTKKKTPGRIELYPERYQRQEKRLREYINWQVRKRKMPIFFER